MKKYFSLDIESTGLVPGLYSMLSLGFCVVGRPEVNFYREIKPINMNFDIEAMKIGCLGLRCLEEIKTRDKSYDARSKYFNPERVLKLMKKNCMEPAQAMIELDRWTRVNSFNYSPKCVAAPISFDFPFISYYFSRFFKGNNPFGFSAEDINSMYRGERRNVDAHISEIEIGIENKEPHNSLSDAIHQSLKFNYILKSMGYNNPSY